MAPLVWFLVAVGLCAGELLTLDLVLLMLGGAALAGGATALVTDSLPAQCAVAAVTAVVLLALVRPVARRHLEVPSLPWGRGRLAGRTATVVQPVTHDSGQVRVDGELWRARPYAGGPDIDAGAAVVIAEVDGATLHVYPQSYSRGELP